MPDVMQQVNELKSLPDQALQFELANPSGAVPAYLVLAEAQRRQLLRSAAQAQQNSAPVGSVYDDVIRSMMARQPQPGQAPAGMTPPPASPPSQPQNMRPPLQMAEGGDVDEDDDGGDGGDGGTVEMPTKFNLNQAVTETARRHNLDPADLWGVVQTESRGNPNAVGPKTKHGQAIGLMQLLPSTARQYGVDAADLKNPQQNLEAGASYLDDLKRNYNGDWDLTRAAYNAGPGNVQKYGGIPPFRETEQYLKRADQFANQFKDAQTWRPPFVDPPETRLAPPDLPGPGPDRASADIAAVKAMRSLVPPPGGDTSGLASAQPPDVSAPGPSTPQMPDALSNVFPDVGPRPAAPNVAAAPPPLSGPPAPISVPAATAAAPSQASADIKELQKRIQAMWDEAESAKHPTVKQALFRMLQNFGAGMATTPARNWGGALAGGAAGIAKGFAADQEAARQQELKLLGVSLDTDKMLQEHEDRAATLRATAQNEAYKDHDDTYAKANGVILGRQGDPPPGPGYQAEPSLLNPGRVYWYTGTGMVTKENQQFIPGAPPVGSSLPIPLINKANDSWRKSQESIATAAAKPPVVGEEQLYNAAWTYAKTHPVENWDFNSGPRALYDQVQRSVSVPQADKDKMNITAEQAAQLTKGADKVPPINAQQLYNKAWDYAKKNPGIEQWDFSDPQALYTQVMHSQNVPDTEKSKINYTWQQQQAQTDREAATAERQRVANENSLNRVINTFGGRWQKQFTDTGSTLDKIRAASDDIGSGAVGQALGIPKLLTALVSGSGTGVRLTQAEINQIAHSRGIAGDIEGFFNKWSGQGTLTQEQIQQAQGLLSDVGARIQQKAEIFNNALFDINNAKTPEDVKTADNKYRQMLLDMEKLTPGGGGGGAKTSGTSGGAGGAGPHGAAQGGYKINGVYGGKRYLGGDIKDANSWQQVQQ